VVDKNIDKARWHSQRKKHKTSPKKMKQKEKTVFEKT
jgi:hypothetical protein